MQSNGNAVQTSKTDVPPPVKERKKLPPKPPKRVSFDLRYRQIIQKSPVTTSELIINCSQDELELKKLNGDTPNPFITEGSNNNISVKQTKVDELRINKTESNLDKNCDKPASPVKTNTNICDTGQVDNDICNKRNEIPTLIKPEIRKTSTSERLRLEFVKSNDNSVDLWPLKSPEKRSSIELITSPKSPTSDIQTRLSESQSKIAKLQKSLPTKLSDATVESLRNRSSLDSHAFQTSDIQSRLSESQSKIAKLRQSLPTKLSEATVESLKNKYSPASFGYPKSFVKPEVKPNENSKIPVTKTQNPSVAKNKPDNSKEENQIVDETVDKNTSKPVTVERKRTFRTELYIPPNGNEEKNEDLNESVDDKISEDKVDTSDVVLDKLPVPIVQAKLVSSEIFPKDPIQPVQSSKEIEPVIEENNNKIEYQTVNKSNEETDDPSEHSSDTLTESEDSQILIRSKNTDTNSEPSSPKFTDVRKPNLKPEDSDNTSFTSFTSCDSEKETKMEEQTKKPQKKRSNSFRRIFSFGSSKDKKKNEDPKNAKTNANGVNKKKDNMLSDNAQNEAHVFDRNIPQRHTFSGHNSSSNWDRKHLSAKENVPSKPYYSNSSDNYRNHSEPYSSHNYDSSKVTANYENKRATCNIPVSSSRQSRSPNRQGTRIEDRLNKIQLDLYLAQQTNRQLNANITINSQQCSIDEYVCMDNNEKINSRDLTQPGFINAQFIDKYIDTTSSSSISTMESDNRNIIYENTSQKLPKVQNANTSNIPFDKSNRINSSPIGEKCYERPKFADSPEMFTTTPRRTQGPQLIKPKAIIPINTERPLPNPYRNLKDGDQDNRDIVYGNIQSPDNFQLNDITKQYQNKDIVYGKPVPASRRNIPFNDSSKDNNVILDETYGTVYDSLIPVGAQLKITKQPIINGGKNVEKRSRSVSPSQRQKAVNLSSSQSFNYKCKPPPKSRSPSSPSSPNRKELESTKLRLPSNREKLEPRLKSPIDDRRGQPQRKNADSIKKDNKTSTSTHQNLEIEIDYPENNINEMQDRKDTPEKCMFSSDNDNPQQNEPTSPKRTVNLKRSAHVSPNRPKSFTHSTPKHEAQSDSNKNFIVNSQIQALRSPVLNRAESPMSVTSSHSLSSVASKTKLPVRSVEELKDLKNTEVYYWEQTSQENLQNIKKEDVSPDQSPQQVLTQATVHQPHVSPRRSDPGPPKNVTPNTDNRSAQTKVPVSPQKLQNLQKVEAFYWQQIKKLKEKEENEYYNQHLQMLARQNAQQINERRSRSMHAGSSRQGERRSLSLPRDSVPPTSTQKLNNDLYGYARTGRQNTIPEGRPLDTSNIIQHVSEYGVVRQNRPFIRGSPQRSTVGPISTQKQSPSGEMIYENYFPGVELRHQSRSASVGNGYAPIFKRGSLSSAQEQIQDSPPQGNKKVSFSSAQSDEGQVWPTKNGFTQSPPTRRVDKRIESVDDDVFLPPTPGVNTKHMQQLQYDPRIPPNYNQSKEPVYVTNKLPPIHPNSNQQIYSSKVPQREPIYGRTASGKPVTVTNKVCDMYGQIHEQPVSPSKLYGNIQKTGVIYGQLQANPVPGSPASSLRNQSLNHSDPCFVRGTRLTASFNDMRSDAPRRPLPPIPSGSDLYMQKIYNRVNPPVSESESGSEAGEVQRILEQREKRRIAEEEWNSDSKTGRNQSDSSVGGGRGGIVDNDGEVRGSRSARSGRRDDPRRHTLSGADQHYPAGMAVQQGGPLSRTMDLEMPMPRGYPPPSSAMLFDDDPGIMSEVETSSTGFRRGGKQRSSLPVVRTPSKTLERPLGLVFLQYRNETKRALLPNEITSIDTVKALFVRSFPKQLTMEYLDSPLVKIYIHDSSKDMFYELEDLRSHLRDIRDRSVLRLFESADISGGLPGPGTGISGGVGHFEDQSYFSEPEFDSEYQHQHIHKSKTSGAKGAPPYYMGSTTLPRGGPLLRAYSPAIGGPIPADRLKALPAGAPPKPLRTYTTGGSNAAPQFAPGGRGSGILSRASERFNTFHSQADLRHRSDNPLFSMPDRIHTDGYMSSPERGSRAQYEDPYYSQYATRSGSITPVIDEEASDTELLDESYSLYGVKLPQPGGPRAVPAPRTQFPPAPTAVPYDATRIRVENMERQLANLTGLVQKALHQTPTATREFLQVPSGRDSYRSGDEFDKNSSSSSASLPDKSVSFEKSVSFSDEPPNMNSPKQHSPQHTADTKPPKPAIKSSTLPRTSSQERDRLKPAPPPKPASLSPAQYDNSRNIYRDLQLTPEMYNQLRGLQKKAKDLRTEVRNLRRLSQAQAHSVRETIRDTFIKIRAMLLASGEQVWQAGIDQEKLRLSREEDLYKQEMIRLEKDLTELEATVEELRGNVINRKTRVNMSDVENMALILSKSSKTVADLKLRFPGLQDAMKNLLSSEMEKVVREEKFLKEEPERLETALRRCKKLTGTLVTLKRLASVQEQRLPCANNTTDGRLSPTLTETPPITPPSAQHSKSSAVSSSRTLMGQSSIGGDSDGGSTCDGSQRPENALDALLDELQTFSKPHSVSSTPSTVTTQLPQGASYTAKIGGSTNTPTMGEIGRKGSMDSATLLPVQNLTVSTATGSLRRLHSYPSGSDTDNSPPIQPLQRMDSRGASANKPPIPERNAELLQHLASGRRVPPPPPPRTSSKSPLASPTSPSLPPRSIPNPNPLQHIQNVQNMTNENNKQPQSQFEAATQNLGLGTLRRNVPGRSSLKEKSQTLPRNIGSNLQVQVNNDGLENKPNPMSTSNSSSCESVNSQEGAKKGNRKEELEQRHQELLKKQKALQEQYARLQQLQRGNNTLTVVPPAPDLLLKKTGSESNLLQKMGLQMTAPQQMSGSLTHLANASLSTLQTGNSQQNNATTGDAQVANATQNNNNNTTNKVYETDIL